jgi:predicted transcriptional regulator
VHGIRVKNITLSADDELIEKARRLATEESRSLNDLFRDWLKQYVNREFAARRFDDIHERLSHVRSGGPYTRDEMNER